MSDDIRKVERRTDPRRLRYVKMEPVPEEETCSGCGYCVPDKNVHCPKCCDLGFPF